MGTVNIRHYPFDFHTHFWGILPVQPPAGDSISDPSIENAIKLFYRQCGEPMTWLDVKRRVFSLGLRQAFTMYNDWFPSGETPTFQSGIYERGECFVENALIGWNLLAQQKAGEVLPRFWAGIENPDDGLAQIEEALGNLENPILGVRLSTLDEREKTSFEEELTRLVASGFLSAAGESRILQTLNSPTATMGNLASSCDIFLKSKFYTIPFLRPAASIYRYYDYFNNLMFSCNEFTPFDDAYKSRDAVKKLTGAGSDGPVDSETYLIDETNRYYAKEGITHTQLSMSRKTEGPLYNRFNLVQDDEHSWGPYQKILYHNVNHNIGSDVGELYKFLDEAVSDFNKVDTEFRKRVIGVDFLGSETHVDFEALFQVMQKFNDTLDAPEGKASFTLRIHVGEGSGAAPYNRSVFGQMCIDTTPENATAPGGHYPAFIDGLQSFRPVIKKGGKMDRWPDTIDLIQKIFSASYFDLRFNIFTKKTHDLVSAIAESNMLALYHAATLVNKSGRYTYGPESVFEKVSIRLGHGQHARQYIHALSQVPGLAKGFKQITFDTNLGSNYVTGSSSNIMSPEDYNRAEGIRTLTSFAPSKYVMQAINAVFGVTALSDALYRNAFPLLVGSDGQGVEHTNLERENIRGLVLSVLRSALANEAMTDRNLLETDTLLALGLVNAELASDLTVTFMFDDARGYWERTVGPPGDFPAQTIPVSGGAWISELRVEPINSGFSGFQYYKAPEFDVQWFKG